MSLTLAFDFGDNHWSRDNAFQYSAIVHGRRAAIRCTAAAAESTATANRIQCVSLCHFRSFGDIFRRTDAFVCVIFHLIVHRFGVAIRIRFIRFLWIFKLIAFPVFVQFIAFEQDMVTICGAVTVATEMHNDLGAVRRTGTGRSTMWSTVTRPTSSRSVFRFCGDTCLFANQINVLVVVLFDTIAWWAGTVAARTAGGLCTWCCPFHCCRIVRTRRNGETFLTATASSTTARMNLHLNGQRIGRLTSCAAIDTARSIQTACGALLIASATVRIEKILHAIVNHFLWIMQIERFARYAAIWTWRRQSAISHWIYVEAVVGQSVNIWWRWLTCRRLIVKIVLRLPYAWWMQIKRFRVGAASRRFRHQRIVRWRRQLLVIAIFCGFRCSFVSTCVAVARPITRIHVICRSSMLNQHIQTLRKYRNRQLKLNDGNFGCHSRPTSTCWFSAASFMGLLPYLSSDSFAPWLSNHRTAAKCPRDAAKCNGVAPSPSRKFGSTPWSST